MSSSPQLDAIIASLKTMLVTHGKDVNIVEANEQAIKLQLSGFCGECGCSSDYVDGLREMLTEHFPTHKIEFDIV